MAWTYYPDRCTCKYTWTEVQGCYDTVTNEWLPDKPTLHITVEADPNCKAFA